MKTCLTGEVRGYKHQPRGNRPFCTNAMRKIGGWVEVRWWAEPQAFFDCFLTKFLMGRCGVSLLERVAVKWQDVIWNKGKAFPEIEALIIF